MKVGGEYLYDMTWMFVCNRCNGILDAQGGPIPANIESLFPNLMDVSTWNYASLSSISRKYVVGVGGWKQNVPRKVYAGWVQDDWNIRKGLTLNLGVRYDLETGVFSEHTEFLPFLKANRPSDTNNFGPRAGFAYSLDDRTVIRGGAGKYFGEISGQPAFWTVRYTEQIHPEILYDGRPDFAINPFNGPAPSYAQALATTCAVSPGPTCVRREIPSQLAASDMQIAYSYQGSVGVQRQIANTASVEADYVTTRARAELYHEAEYQPDVQPGDGRELPVHRHQPPAVSQLRADQSVPIGWLVQLSGAADRVHAAHEPRLAGIGDLSAGDAQGCAVFTRPVQAWRPTWVANTRSPRRISATARSSTGSGSFRMPCS